MLRRVMMAQAASGGGDPYWANVVSLLNFPGADGSTTFTDEKGKSWTAYGNAQIDTSLGYNAGLFDGSGDYIQCADHADFEFGAGDFCIEQVVRMTAVAGDIHGLWQKRGTGFSAGDLIVFVSNGELWVYCYDVDSASNIILKTTGGPITDGLTFHWALYRSGTTFRLALNGSIVASTTSSATLTDSAAPVTVGMDNVSGGRFWLNGRILSSRVTKGATRYGGSTFTPPTAPFPDS